MTRPSIEPSLQAAKRTLETLGQAAGKCCVLFENILILIFSAFSVSSANWYCLQRRVVVRSVVFNCFFAAKLLFQLLAKLCCLSLEKMINDNHIKKKNKLMIWCEAYAEACNE